MKKMFAFVFQDKGLNITLDELVMVHGPVRVLIRYQQRIRLSPISMNNPVALEPPFVHRMTSSDSG